MKKIAFFYLVFNVLCITLADAQECWSKKMAATVMDDYPNGYKEGSKTWSYVIGTVMYGFETLYLKTGDQTYSDYIKETVDNEITSSGDFNSYKVSAYNSDQLREGNSVLFLYEQNAADNYKTALQLLRSQIDGHPRTSEGGFWHKKSYEYQMWLDGLYMVEPFYARYSHDFNNSDEDDLDDIVNQFYLIRTHLRDSITGLYYHGWDEKKTQVWANSETGLSQCFWGRSMGWLGMALVDVLDYFPESNEHYNELVDMFEQLMIAVVNYQEPESGAWYNVIDYETDGYGSDNGNYLEGSCSCMFTYCLLKGARKGYLADSLQTIGVKAYEGLLNTFITEINGSVSVNYICKSAGLGGSSNRMGDFAYYMSESIVSNDGKGIGPFIVASVEYEKLNETDVATIITSSMKIYFNTDNQQIVVNGDVSENTSVNIYDLNGRAISLTATNINNRRINIDATELKQGLYLIRVNNGTNVQTNKILKY